MTTTNTPAKPQRNTPYEPGTPCEPDPTETGPVSPRSRGRHRKPRPRKALLAAGGLALAAGALSLVRLTSGPGTDSVATVEAEPRPDPVTTGTDEAANTDATALTTPEASPSSPTALGGPPPSPGTRGPADASSAPSASLPVDTRGADRAATPRPTTTADAARPQAPTATGNGKASRPAQTTPSPPDRNAPAAEPEPEPEQPKKPHDPGLCVPVIGLCLDPPR
ncbi:hypothetical protein AB0E64_07060 [Streptomyces caelestis]|uniref:Uncharacterized protein n=1 Tax=Streptomyces caelestis TaxID=36816 RepID=A0A7W9LUW2_9ACTN|nr:hypothetical protein [Streptomyces caelestis]MBB5797170.1 hypothetical protein [Streptomyces caelestis]GGW36262.1 hypothetical protein GCM10010320_14620 [Streptomyces caelestis]